MVSPRAAPDAPYPPIGPHWRRGRRIERIGPIEHAHRRVKEPPPRSNPSLSRMAWTERRTLTEKGPPRIGSDG